MAVRDVCNLSFPPPPFLNSTPSRLRSGKAAARMVADMGYLLNTLGIVLRLLQDVGPDVQPIALEHILQEVRSGDGTQSYSVRTQGLPRDYRP